MADPGRVRPDIGQVAADVQHEGPRPGPGPSGGTDSTASVTIDRGATARNSIRALPGFEPADVEEAVEDLVEAVAVLPGRRSGARPASPFRLPILLFEKKMDGHAHRGQRGIQLMGDGPDDAPLDLVLLPELGDVLEDEDHPGRQPLVVQDGHGFGAVVAFFALDELLDGSAGPRERPGAACLKGLAAEVGHPAERKIADHGARVSARRRVLADSVATSTLPSGSMTATASGRLSKACWVALWIRRSLAWSVLRNSRRLAAMALNASDRCPISSRESLATTRSRLPRRISSADRMRRWIGRRIHLLVKKIKTTASAVPTNKRIYICRRARRGAPAGAVVGVAHVLLVHLEDLVGRRS